MTLGRADPRFVIRNAAVLIWFFSVKGRYESV